MENENKILQEFWAGLVQKHPKIFGVLSTVGAAFGFFLNGHFIVFGARWVIRVCGYIAEAALLFSVLWISASSVTPQLLELFLSKSEVQFGVWLALLALALIPEVILGNAIIRTVKHWYVYGEDKHDIVNLVWAIAFTLPTLMFFILTSITIGTLTANGGNLVQAGNYLLGARCYTGWIYGLLAGVYFGVSRFTKRKPLPADNVDNATADKVDIDNLTTQLTAAIDKKIDSAVNNALSELSRKLTAQFVAVRQELSTQVTELTEQVTIPALSGVTIDNIDLSALTEQWELQFTELSEKLTRQVDNRVTALSERLSGEVKAVMIGQQVSEESFTLTTDRGTVNRTRKTTTSVSAQERNNKLEAAYQAHWRQHGKAPTNRELEELTEVNRTTCGAWIREYHPNGIVTVSADN